MKPIGHLMLVKPTDNYSEQEKKTSILLPDHDNVFPDRGKVIAIGSKVTEVKVGDYILFDRIRVDNFRDRTGKLENNLLFVDESLVKATYES